jgi:vanillate/3-O-methylgallate O-demethylase
MTNADSLQALVDQTPDLVEYFRNDVPAPPHFSRVGSSKTAVFIPPAFTNWRDEQYASFETVGLLHQSHHMPELFIDGPDAVALLKSVLVNSFENFALDQAKQVIGATPSGHHLGDSIAYRHGEDSFEVISGAPLLNWIEYNARTGDWDVEVVRDNASNTGPAHTRTRYRFELVGPHVGRLFDRLVEGGAPEIPFFRKREVRIAGHDVLVLRHGMVGDLAVELSGPFAEEDEVRSHILQVGEEFGIVPIGTTTYFGGVQSGWYAYPLPGIFTDPELRAYREYLPGDGWEASTEVGGSLVHPRIEDYYLTPFDLGYGKLIKDDHDFVGREALAAVPDEAKRTKVTLEWNSDDVRRVLDSQFAPRPRFKGMDFPQVSYSWTHMDAVHTTGDELIGRSGTASYIGPLNRVLSLAILDSRHAEIGSEVVLTWGEENGGTRKKQVEEHEQTTIRATIAPAPYATNSQRVTHSALLT